MSSSLLWRTVLRRRGAFAAALLLVLVTAGTALAASRGAPWRLGYAETLTGYVTGISGSHTVEVLRILNSSVAAGARAIRAEGLSPTAGALYVRNAGGGPAANFVTNTGQAAFTVNTGTKIANLNADRLDSLDSSALQRRVTGTCAPGSSISAVSADGNVTCETDDDSGGDVTGVTAGFGLAGGGSQGEVTLNVDSSVIQQRVSGSCTGGTAISLITFDGQVLCAADVGRSEFTRYSFAEDSGGEIGVMYELMAFFFGCAASAEPSDKLFVVNYRSSDVEYWLDDGSANPTVGIIPAMVPGFEASNISADATKAGDQISVQLGSGSGSAFRAVSIIVSSWHPSGGPCVVQAQQTTTG